MSQIVNDLDARIAHRVKLERELRGWSLGELATRSGVSKAMISRIERAETSATAALLGRLSAAFGLTLSTILARAEAGSGRLARAAAQPIWQDPETGFTRRAISPGHAGILELVRGELPARAKVSYPAAAYAFIHQQIWVLSGTLRFTEGRETHDLGAGDCLELGSPADCSFENPADTPCAYLVALVKR